MTVRTRFAPSPTGVLHLGSVRTALFCWLYAKHCGGKYILRIEDTDRERSTPENVEAILDGMSWLGIHADEGPYYQTERFERYGEVIEDLLKSGKAYRCYCTRADLDRRREEQRARGETTRYDGRCRDRKRPVEGAESVIRFRMPQLGNVVVNDLVRGRVSFDNSELDDLIIARSDGTPTYNFTVVVDDNDMRISHVIRGDDHLNNTPKQMNMLEAIGGTVPNYAHLPMILGPDGAKLSKRHGAVDIRDYREQGYLPEALLNYLVRLGWSRGDQEIFSIDEMIEYFDIDAVNQSASSFNPEKLLWLNQQHISSADPHQLGENLVPYLVAAQLDPREGPNPADVAAVFSERAQTLVELAESARYCYEDFADIDAGAAKKHLRPVILEPLRAVQEKLTDLETWSTDEIDRAIRQVAESFDIGFGKLGQPMRVAVTGNSISPPIDATLFLIGKARTVERIYKALEFIESRATSGKVV